MLWKKQKEWNQLLKLPYEGSHIVLGIFILKETRLRWNVTEGWVDDGKGKKDFPQHGK